MSEHNVAGADHDASPLLSVLGIFFYQSNTLSLGTTHSELVAERAWRKAFSPPLTDHRAIQWHLTYRHELDHLIKFTLSPLLAFLDDCYDMQVSSFDHAIRRLFRARGQLQRFFDKPLAECANRGELPTDVLERVMRMHVCRRLVHRMIFSDPTPRELLYDLNLAIQLIADSKGLPLENVATVRTRLPPDEPIGGGWTIHGVLEAAARWQESGTLHEHDATPGALRSWRSKGLFGIYAQVYPELEAIMDADVMAIALSLCTQGAFFPFHARTELWLEDFHPVVLLRRIIDELRGKGWLSAGSQSEARCLDLYRQIYATLNHRFGLVDDADAFVANRAALDSRFPAAFPDVYTSHQYQTYLLERKRLNLFREDLFVERKENPLVVADRIETNPDRYLLRDAVHVVDDAVAHLLYTVNGGPLLAHDRRMGFGMTAEWLAFGDGSGFEDWRASMNALLEFHQQPPLKTADWLRQYWGIEGIGF